MTKRKIKIIIVLALLAVLAALIIDSTCRIVVTEHSISSERLPESFEGFTIVQLSDIHGREFANDNARLVKKVEEAQPDIIAITGDLAGGGTNLEIIDSLLEQLTKIAPTYYVSGNHEWGGNRIEELENIFARRGVCYLRNEYMLLERGGESIVLCGVEDPNGYEDMPKPDEVVERLSKEHGESYRILLGHRNYWREKYPNLDVDLIFCGHAHGGLVRLPWIGGLFGSDISLFPDDVDGALESGRYTMVVSRGVGNSAPIPRFLNNPEVVVVKLEKE